MAYSVRNKVSEHVEPAIRSSFRRSETRSTQFLGDQAATDQSMTSTFRPRTKKDPYTILCERFAESYFLDGFDLVSDHSGP